MLIGATFAKYDFRAYNAVKSWQKAFPNAKVFLFGEECRYDTLDVDIVRYVERRYVSEVPLLNDIFSFLALRLADPGELIMYANADICFFPGADGVLHDARNRFGNAPFLLTGQRTNYKVKNKIDWDNREAIATLVKNVLRRGKKMHPCGVDYFIFNQSTFPLGIPAFAVGRCTFDQYLVYDCLARGVPVLDATAKILALHQKHKEDSKSRLGPDAVKNKELAVAVYTKWTPWDGWLNSEGVEKL